MIVEEQSNEFNRLTSPMMWEQFFPKQGQQQPKILPSSRQHQTQKSSLHGTYTIFWADPGSQERIRYEIILNKDKSITDFILDAVDFFSQNSSNFANLYTDIANVKLYIAKENGNKSSTYPPVSIQEVPSVFTLFKTQRKRFFLLEIISDDEDQNAQESNSNSTNSSEMLIQRYPKNYRNQVQTADKTTSIYSDRMKNSKVYNNSFHSQTGSIKEQQQPKQSTLAKQKKSTSSWMWFCCDE